MLTVAFLASLLSYFAVYYQARLLVHKAGQTRCGILLQYVMSQLGTLKGSLGVAALQSGVQCLKKESF